jgi:hypothetical protein
MVYTANTGTARAHDVQIRSGAVTLSGDLSIPAGAQGVVLFAHGSGSSLSAQSVRGPHDS